MLSQGPQGSCCLPSTARAAFGTQTLKSHMHLIILLLRQDLNYLSLKGNNLAHNPFPGTPPTSGGHIQNPRQSFILKTIDQRGSVTHNLLM